MNSFIFEICEKNEIYLLVHKIEICKFQISNKSNGFPVRYSDTCGPCALTFVSVSRQSMSVSMRISTSFSVIRYFLKISPRLQNFVFFLGIRRPVDLQDLFTFQFQFPHHFLLPLSWHASDETGKQHEEVVQVKFLKIKLISKNSIFRSIIDRIEEWSTGMADVICVNSEFTASVVRDTFNSLQNRQLRG